MNIIPYLFKDSMGNYLLIDCCLTSQGNREMIVGCMKILPGNRRRTTTLTIMFPQTWIIHLPSPPKCQVYNCFVSHWHGTPPSGVCLWHQWQYL